ncbi:MAG: aminofutalosine synthase MqnE [Proteobacteria bacterium]|nr:aminofutalosine synthase MqnE [Pseudomonadota bacterium]
MDSFLSAIEEKLFSGVPVSLEEGTRLFAHKDFLSIGLLANRYREHLHGDKTYYNWNLHLNSTNVCEADCLFCSFARLKLGMPEAYSMSVLQARQWISERYRPGMTEIHIVNGLNPDLPFEYYEELLAMVRQNFPALHIKAFTAVEIHYFAQKFGMSYRAALERLRACGLGSLPGGGAEIFAERVRKKICRDKATAAEWLGVHRAAHELGIKTNCTMLYGTIETEAERVDHMIRLRDLQSETGGFQVFIPLAFHNEGNRMERLPAPTGIEDLRVIAISRIVAHNIPHIKAYWVMLGEKIAQVAQQFGADDIDGTVTEEKIYHMAGSQSPNALTINDIRRIITKAGRTPVERSTTYDIIDRGIDSAASAPDTTAKMHASPQSLHILT